MLDNGVSLPVAEAFYRIRSKLGLGFEIPVTVDDAIRACEYLREARLP